VEPSGCLKTDSPDSYGMDDQAFPSEIGGQLADPFRH
jgi:hypothetical protein